MNESAAYYTTRVYTTPQKYINTNMRHTSHDLEPCSNFDIHISCSLDNHSMDHETTQGNTWNYHVFIVNSTKYYISLDYCEKYTFCTYMC